MQLALCARAPYLKQGARESLSDMKLAFNYGPQSESEKEAKEEDTRPVHPLFKPIVWTKESMAKVVAAQWLAKVNKPPTPKPNQPPAGLDH